MPRISSTAVERVDYDEDRQVLDIRYAGGDRYSYFDVPRAVYDALLAADSAGGFVNREIKPRYRCEIEPRRRRFRPSSED